MSDTAKMVVFWIVLFSMLFVVACITAISLALIAHGFSWAVIGLLALFVVGMVWR